MNRENWTVAENSSCTVCGAAVEVGTATSRCSDRTCITRDRDNNLSTDSDKDEVIEYWKQKFEEECEKRADVEVGLSHALTREEIRAAALSAFEDYVRADNRTDAEDAEIRVDTYLSHLDKGWGWLKEESDAV